VTSQDQRSRDEGSIDQTGRGGGHPGRHRVYGSPGRDGAGRASSDGGDLGSKEEAPDSLPGWSSADVDGSSALAVADGSGTPVEQEFADLAQENENLRVAIDSRAVIEQAKGALMLRYGLDQDTAFAVLKRWSQDSNIKLHTIAQTLVDWATGNDAPPGEPRDSAERLEKDLAALFGADASQEK
jgi:hypothetical protein